MEVTGQIHASAALPGSRFPLNGRLGGPQSRPGRFAQKLRLLNPMNPAAHRLGSLVTTLVPSCLAREISEIPEICEKGNRYWNHRDTKNS